MPSPNTRNDADLFDMLVAGSIRKVTDGGEALSEDDAPTTEGMIRDTTDLKALAFGEVEHLRSVTVPFDHKLAQRLVNFENVPGERPLSDRHVVNLQTAMTNSMFVGEIVNLAVVKCLADGKVYRINGQHTSWGRIGLPTTHPTVNVSLHMYQSATLAGVRALYAQYDRGRTRNNRQVVDSYLIGTPPFDKYQARFVQTAAAGLTFHLYPHSDNRAAHGPDTIVALMTGEHKAATLHILEIFGQNTRPAVAHILRASVVGAMYATFMTVTGQSKEFWTAIRDGTGLDQVDDPRLRLRNDLIRNAVASRGSGVTRTSAKDTISTEAMYRTCLHAWNAWREKRPLLRLSAGKSMTRPKAK